MNAKQKLHQVHLQEWTVRFADQKASGLTVRQWCEQNNLSFHTYNEYSRAMKSHFRKFGNQMSGSGNHLCNYASLLA